MQKKSTSKVLALFLTVALLLGIASPISVLALSSEPQNSIQVDPEVMQEMETKGSASYWIDFDAKADLSAANSMDWSKRGWYVYETLSKTANASQARVAAYLTDSKVEYQPYWIKNTILVKSSNLTTLNGLLGFSEIKAISPRQTYILYEPDRSAAVMDNGLNSIEPNLTHINADDVWAMGIDGSGLVVASIDTGVRYTHQALVNQYRGNNGDGTFDHNYNWFNPDDLTDSVPRDGNGHGTHTMGTMVGDDGDSNQIGIAPGAQWMACAGCPDGSCPDTALLGCGQFIAAPTDLTGSNPDPDMRPNAVNNSWGDCGQTYDDWYADVISAWHAEGIYPIFSNGNASNCGYSSPPGLNTVGNPARSGDVTGVGSSGEQNGQYATHSNWGPTDDPDIVNPTDGFDMMKPQVLAPGVSIRSSVPTSDTSYEDGWSGTSMSAPHVTGLVALIWQAAPCLVGDYATTENLIESTAVDIVYDDGSGLTPTNFPNFATGWGEIDALAAVTQASGLCAMGTLEGTVTEDGTTPIEGAKIFADNGEGYTKSIYTAADGSYSTGLPEGIYTLTASKYGFDTVIVSGIEIVEDKTTTQNFVLGPLGMTTVSGVVYDAGVDESMLHGYPLYALIHISASGFDQTIYSDPITGEYSIELVSETEHTFEVTSVVSGYETLVETVTPTTENLSHDIGLNIDATVCAAPGYMGSGVNEGFESGTLPIGWVNYDYLGNGQVWQFDDPGGWGNLTPGGNGGFAILDSDFYGYGGQQNAGLRTPAIDFSGETTITLAFDTAYKYYSGDSATVRVSADNGATWTNVWSKTADFVDHVTLDISAQAAGHANVIVEFKYVGSWDYYWEVDDVLITPMNCELASGGAVAGYVTDEMSGEPLIGADVYSDTVATKSFALEGDLDNAGIYWLFQPTDTNLEEVSFTASKDLYANETATVSVEQNAVTQQDFALGTGELTFDPTEFEFTMDMGDEPATDTLTIGNNGTSDATFELVEKDQGFTPLNIPAFTGELPEDNREVSLGRAPQAATNVSRSSSAKNDLGGILSTPPAFAMEDVYPGGNLVYIPDTTVPGTWEVVGLISGLSFFAGDFVGGDFDTMYVVDFNNNGLYAVDTATGAYTQIGTTTPPAGSINGLSGTPDGIMYGIAGDCATSYLVTVDITSGATTNIGSIPGVGCGIDLAYNTNDDMIYVVDLLTSSLFRVDPVTAAATLVGFLGVSPNYAQGMDFEEESGVLYWAAYTTTGELRVIDTTTGASTLIGAFPGGAQVDCLAFPTAGSSDVPWLSEGPVSGTVTADGSVEVEITVDPSDLDQPGDYEAALKVKHNTPHTYPNIPVILHLVAPEDYGTINGTVNGLEACDINPAPIEGVTVNFNQEDVNVYTTTTLANGYYSYSMPAGVYDIEVIADGFVSQTVTDIEVIGGSTLTQNFELRLLAPCIQAIPTELEKIILIGQAGTRTLTLVNTGTVDTDVEIIEMEQQPGQANVSIPAFTGQLPADSQVASIGPAPNVGNAPAASDARNNLGGILSTAPAFAMDVYPGENLVYIPDTTVPGTWEVVGSISGMSFFAGDFVGGDFDTIYVINSDNNRLYAVDTATGAYTLIGHSVAPAGQYWTGLTGTPDGTLYGLSTDIYTTNLTLVDPSTGAVTDLGALLGIAAGIDLAYNTNEDMIYIVDIVSDKLYRVDPATLEVTDVGALGVNANCAQGMDFEEETGVLYWAAYNCSISTGELRVLDMTTGNSSLIGTFPGGVETDCLAFTTGGISDVPWLSEVPVAGTVPAGGSLPITVTFDATGLSVGDYFAGLRVWPDGAPRFDVPVTLHVVETLKFYLPIIAK